MSAKRVLSERDLRNILTLPASSRDAEDPRPPLRVWEHPTWLEVVARGHPQCAAAKLCVMAAHLVLEPGDRGRAAEKNSAVEYHDRLQLRQGGCIVDVRGLAASASVQCDGLDGLTQMVDVIGCAVCVAVNWSRSCGLADPSAAAAAAPMTAVCLARNALAPELMQVFMAALMGTDGRPGRAELFKSLATTFQAFDSGLRDFLDRFVPVGTGDSVSPLQSIDLSCNDVSQSRALPSIVRNNPHLSTLYLACTSCGGVSGGLFFYSATKDRVGRLGIGDSFKQGPKPLEELCKYIGQSGLERLDLSGNGLGAQAVGPLVKLLSAAGCPVKELNLAYNAFDPLHDTKLKGYLASKDSAAADTDDDGEGRGKGGGRHKFEIQEHHPAAKLFTDGLMHNTSLRSLDMTGSFRFGVLDPSRSCDPDDRLLDGNARDRKGLNVPNAVGLGNSVLVELEHALKNNDTLAELWMGELELEGPAIEILTHQLRRSGGGWSGDGGSGSSSSSSSSSSSLHSAGGKKRKRMVYGAKPGDAKRAVANWFAGT
jgi:hypothetical protein